jgi:hypothetical protein
MELTQRRRNLEQWVPRPQGLRFGTLVNSKQDQNLISASGYIIMKQKDTKTEGINSEERKDKVYSRGSPRNSRRHRTEVTSSKCRE